MERLIPRTEDLMPPAEIVRADITVDEYGDKWMLIDGIETKVAFADPHRLSALQTFARNARRAALDIEREKARQIEEREQRDVVLGRVGTEAIRQHAIEWLERQGLLDEAIEDFRKRKQETRWQRLRKSAGTLKRSVLSGVRSVLRIVGMGRTE